MPASIQNGNLSEFTHIPIQSIGTLIAFKEVDGEIYYVNKEILIKKNQVEHLTLVKISENKFEEELQKLDLEQTSIPAGEIWIE